MNRTHSGRNITVRKSKGKGYSKGLDAQHPALYAFEREGGRREGEGTKPCF